MPARMLVLAAAAALGFALIERAQAQGASPATSADNASTASGGSASDGSLQEVVVTARSIENELPQQLAKFGTRVDTVSAGQILSGGYIDVPAALEALTPGLYIASNAGPFNYVDVSLQGSRTEDVLWLVDDVRINNRLYAGTTPLDTIPASMIERIEVLDGGQSLFYGTQATAGVVNIVTKSFSAHPDGAFSLGADSNDGKHLNGYFRDALDDNYFVVYGTHDESPGISPYPTADYQPSGADRHRQYNVTTLGLKYAYDFTNDLAVSTLYQHTDATLGLPGPAVTAAAYNQRDEDLLTAKLDYVPSDAFKFFVKGYYHRWSSYYTEFDNGSTAYSYTPGAPGQLTVAENDGFWGYKDYGANLMTQFELTRGLEAILGYDLQSYIGRDTVLVIQQETERINAFFGQLRLSPDLIPGLHFAAGLRENIASFGPSALVWNSGGEYDFGPSMYVKANVGTAFRLPTDEELFANDPEDERGDPNLKPETSHDANVAIGGAIPVGRASPLKWEAMTFYRSIDNLIDYESFDAQTGQSVFGNVPGRVRTLGEQLTLEASLTASLSATLSGTYNHARQSGMDDPFDRIPTSVTKATLDYHPSRSRFGANLAVQRIGSLNDQPFGSGTSQVGYGNYTILDLSGRYFLDQERHQRIDVHVDNVFNHVCYSGLEHAQTDTTGTPYIVHALALPRTFQANYTYSF